MTRSQLVVQRDDTLVLTRGDDCLQHLETLRVCASLSRIVAGDFVLRLSPVAIWGSAARGVSLSEIVDSVAGIAAVPVPASFVARISTIYERYGALSIRDEAGSARLFARDPLMLSLIEPLVGELDIHGPLNSQQISQIRVAGMRCGWPVVDERTPHLPGDDEARLRFTGALRPYQQDAIDAFNRGGSGVVLLPCGAGKTTVGVAAACQAGGNVLVVAPSRTVVDQWRDAFAQLTSIAREHVSILGAGSGISDVTLATYHAATGRSRGSAVANHAWSLIIYDEVQSLPADTFRIASAFQSSRRLGLTATLVREDGREAEILALVGPALYDVSWTALERAGWIAPARCIEVRLPYHPAPVERTRYKIAAIQRLLHQHEGEPVLVSGSNVASLSAVGRRLQFPVLTGESVADERSDLFDAFRNGRLPVLGLSRIGTVGIDLPNASVLIQMSGTFGSRQEEAQRLGRILRPAAAKTAWFYSLVSDGTREVQFADRRQRYLIDRGYQYEILRAEDIQRAQQLT